MLSNIIINDSRYKIAVGKYKRDFTVIDNQFTQIMNVIKLINNNNRYGIKYIINEKLYKFIWK